MKKLISALAVVSMVWLVEFSLSSCENHVSIPDLSDVVVNTTGHEEWNNLIDYSDMDNWLAVPSTVTKDVDAVYFYPTTYYPSKDEPNLCSIDNNGMRKGAQVAFRAQATVFQQSCNVYAPYYRQLDAQYALTLSDEDNETLIRYAVSKDATAALDYYFEHFNNGRPFILAGHSQGSETALYLLSDYFSSHPDYYKRMVAAYIIGYSVTSDFLAENPHLTFAKGADDTGVVVSWNTEGPGNIGKHNAVLLPNAISINPINWKLDDTKADVSENKGSLDSNGQIGVGIADAQVNLERGSVVCTSVDPAKYCIPYPELFGPECYHGYDYGFYYGNIMENVEERILNFVKN